MEVLEMEVVEIEYPDISEWNADPFQLQEIINAKIGMFKKFLSERNENGN